MAILPGSTENQKYDHRRGSPCPLCGGYDELPRHEGRRCSGHTDGDYVHCERTPGGREEKNNLRTHYLRGTCECGVVHADAPPPKANSGPERQLRDSAEYPIRYENDKLFGTKVRREYTDGQKDFFWKGGLGGKRVEGAPLLGSRRLYFENPFNPVIVVEGEKKALVLINRGFNAVGTVTGAGVTPTYKALRPLRRRHVILWPDFDDPGRRHMDRIGQELMFRARSIRTLTWGEKEGDDAWDFLSRGGTDDQLDTLMADAPLSHPGMGHAESVDTMSTPGVVIRMRRKGTWWPAKEPVPARVPRSPLRSYTLDELDAMPIPDRELLVAPYFGRQETAFLYGPKGHGKTWVGATVAALAATGGGATALRFTAAEGPGVPVLYVDGEMLSRDIRQRFRDVCRTTTGLRPGSNLKIWTPDRQPEGTPPMNIFTEEGRKALDAHIADLEAELGRKIALIVIDNLRTLAPGWKENDADSFLPIGAWTIAQRAAGRAVILMHHSNKEGGYSGNTAIVTSVHAILAVRHPKDWTADEGAHFDFSCEFTRTAPEAAVRPFNAHLEAEVWTIVDAEGAHDEIIRFYTAQGLGQTAIGEQINRDKDFVTRRQKHLGIYEKTRGKRSV